MTAIQTVISTPINRDQRDAIQLALILLQDEAVVSGSERLLNAACDLANVLAGWDRSDRFQAGLA